MLSSLHVLVLDTQFICSSLWRLFFSLSEFLSGQVLCWGPWAFPHLLWWVSCCPYLAHFWEIKWMKLTAVVFSITWRQQITDPLVFTLFQPIPPQRFLSFQWADLWLYALEMLSTNLHFDHLWFSLMVFFAFVPGCKVYFL